MSLPLGSLGETVPASRVVTDVSNTTLNHH